MAKVTQDASMQAQKRIPGLASLQGRLIVLVCAMVIITAAVSVGLVVRQSHSALVAQQLRNMEQVTGATAARVQLRSKLLQTMLANLARDPALLAAARGIAADPSDLRHSANLEQLLGRHSMLEQQPVNMAFFSADGRLLKRYGGSIRPRPNARIQGEDGSPRVVALARHMPVGTARVLGPFVAETTLGEPHPWLASAAPVHSEDGQLLGILQAEQDVHDICLTANAETERSLSNLKASLVFLDPGGGALGDQRAAELADQAGAIRGWLGETPTRATSGEAELSAGRFVVAAAGLPDSATGPGQFAIVAVIASEDTVAAEARRPLRSGLAAVAGVLLLAVVLGIAMARGISRPLERLVESVRRFGEGGELGEVQAGRGEVGRLAQAFGDMAARVQERNRRLAHEVEERQRAERESHERALRLEASESRYRQLYQTMPAGVITAAADGQVRTANPAALEVLGFAGEAELRRANIEADIWVGPGRYGEILNRVRQEGGASSLEARLRRQDGRACWVLVNISAVWGTQGDVVAFEIALVDITERKAAEYSQRASELRFRRLYDSNMLGVAFGTLSSGAIHEANTYTLSLLGYQVEDLPLPVATLLPDGCDEIISRLRQSLGLRQPMHAFERNLVRRDGGKVPVLVNAAMLDVNREEFVATIIDRSEAIAAERVNRELKDFFKFVLDSIPVRVAYVDARERIRFFNQAYLEWYGTSAEVVRGRLISEIVDAARYKLFEPYLRGVMAGVPQKFEYAAGQPGKERHFETSYQPHVGPDGKLAGFFAVSHEITETRALEARLRHSQKLEAVGQLTGGIAHDFNNLLSVVMGNLQLLERELQEETPRRALLAALRAAGRGAELTRRLLTFSRRQALAPRVLDLRQQLDDICELVDHSIGESFDVVVSLAPDLWAVSADPTELENALLNLAINARDAMPGGGRIDIEAENVLLDPVTMRLLSEIDGPEVVRIAVRDRGCGMPADVAAQAFEPFFTTKGEDQGSGLGLSMVYGFMRQSGGAVRVRSEQGRGTAVELFFPRSHAVPAAAAVMPMVPAAGRSEGILVVEDDADVREVTVALLEGLGYRVCEAADGAAALAALAADPDISLALCDVGLPGGLQGPALAEQIADEHPWVAVLLVTASTAANPVLEQLAARGELLFRPVDPQELAVRIRSLIADRQPRLQGGQVAGA